MGRTVLIGDIHGCFEELMALLAEVGLKDEDLLISVGDLVDRGPQPAEVVAFFRSRPNTVVICGNHERKHIRKVFSYSQHVCRLQMGLAYDDAVAWMATLPYHYEDEQVRVVHWGLYPGVPLDEVPEDVRAGTTSGDGKLRERFGDGPWYEHYTDDKPVVFGHAVVGDEPLVIDGRIFGLDTGACHGGTLTALILPERRLVSVRAREDHWVRVRDAWEEPYLRTLAFETMTFEQIAKKVRGQRDPELTGGYLDEVGAWAEKVRAAIPDLAVALDALLARLLVDHGEEGLGRAAAAHPAASHLQRRRLGKLSSTSLGCATPAEVLALGRALGVPVPELDRMDGERWPTAAAPTAR